MLTKTESSGANSFSQELRSPGGEPIVICCKMDDGILKIQVFNNTLKP